MKNIVKLLIASLFFSTACFAQLTDTIFVSSGEVNLHTVLMKANTKEKSPLAIDRSQWK
ncbi:hypothetical protein [Jiulongibacter sp. NS-SX5]|uniref:hypothetical protein n=1 Tax=Jiulongibacter sp. NS-SX5 TaxID=3463854 RepID=UPI004059D903